MEFHCVGGPMGNRKWIGDLNESLELTKRISVNVRLPIGSKGCDTV